MDPVQFHLIEDFAEGRWMRAKVVGFCRFLRKQGLRMGLSEQLDAIQALGQINLGRQESFRLALRTTLAKNLAEQELFDEYFHLYWQASGSAKKLFYGNVESQLKSQVRIIDERKRTPSLVPISDGMQDQMDNGEEKDVAGYSPYEVNQKRDFSQFGESELSEVIDLINKIGKSLATRFSHRMHHSRRIGPLNLRRTLRHNLRRGGDLLDLIHHRRKRQRLKLVLICDVSKSMDLYSRFLIQFIYAFQSVYRRIETFVFSTSLHRITEELRRETMEEAVERLSETVPNWSGGTKIGASLNQFVEEYALKLVDPGTVVLIISDGWDTGEVELLEECMALLHQRARSLIWLNPLKGSPDYQPSTRGMQVALPHLDLFSSAHNLNSLKELVSQLMNMKKRT